MLTGGQVRVLISRITGIKRCRPLRACVYQAIRTNLRRNSDVFTGFEDDVLPTQNPEIGIELFLHFAPNEVISCWTVLIA